MKHLLGFLFPFFVCLSIYGIFVLGAAISESRDQNPAEGVVPAELSDFPDPIAAAFNQTRLFSDSELQEAVSFFAAEYSNVSPGIGARVSLPAVSSGRLDAAGVSSRKPSTLLADASEKASSSVEQTEADSGNAVEKKGKNVPETLLSPSPAFLKCGS